MRLHPALRGSAGLLLLLAFPFAAASQETNQGFLTVSQILQDNCAACHDWTASYKGIADPSRVTPGSPEKSSLYTQVASDAMPMGGTPLSVTQKNLLRAWIAAGATESEKPLSLALPEAIPQAGGPEAGGAAAAPAPVRKFNKLKFHQVSGFTSASLFLAAGVVGAVQIGSMMSASHAYRDANNIDENQISSVCANYIMGLWGNPEHTALRWTHVGLMATGEAFYLYNAVTGIGMIQKRAPLSAQALHRYAFFLHGTLMLTQIILGVFTTEVLSTGNHWSIVGLGIAHTAVGFSIPLVMIGSGIAVRRKLKL